jgi:hypothetical protein
MKKFFSLILIFTSISLVSQTTPKELAQQQLDAYNSKQIDAFLKPYAKDVKVYRFPNTFLYEGIETMRKNYADYFKKTPDLHCELQNRIIFKNKVIDHELVTANGKIIKAVAIYGIKDGKISTVTFL